MLSENGYWQAVVNEKHTDDTALVLHRGLFDGSCFFGKPLGLSNTLASFQCALWISLICLLVYGISNTNSYI